jgi:hypothetical protein
LGSTEAPDVNFTRDCLKFAKSGTELKTVGHEEMFFFLSRKHICAYSKEYFNEVVCHKSSSLIY